MTNPFLNQSINQRAEITPSFTETKKVMDFKEQQELKKAETLSKQPTKQATLKSQKTQVSLIDQIKDGVYKMINKFEEELGYEQEFATWEQFKKVMSLFTSDQEDIADFWA